MDKTTLVGHLFKIYGHYSGGSFDFCASVIDRYSQFGFWYCKNIFDCWSAMVIPKRSKLHTGCLSTDPGKV